MSKVAGLLTILLAAAVLTACSPRPISEDQPNSAVQDPREVRVTRVTDGDTVKITPTVDGIEDVRLIGVDTPEKFGANGPQPLAERATAFTTDSLEASAWRVELRFDVETTDKYGRLLAYVYSSDGTLLNETLLRSGYAQVATFPPNVRHLQEFKIAQNNARERNIGIWSLPEGQLCELADRGNGVGGGC